MTPPDRREYGTGSIYKRSSDGRYIGTIEAGYTQTGARRRITVSAKTEAAVKRKLRDKRLALERGEHTGSRLTIKTWADEYLALRVTELRPKAFNAAANPIRNWIIPTIGHRRLEQLTPKDIRAVHNACREAGRSPADVHRALHTMLAKAADDGHPIPQNVLRVKAPASAPSDRAAMTIPEGLAVLEVASTLPHGVRWLVAMLYGSRLGETLGLTWDAVDLDAGELRIEWQLQAIPYKRPRDRSSGFRVPDGYEARHLIDSYHLTRPKSKAGYRVAPMIPAVRDGLIAWRAIAPPNPWGLVWPNLKGRPANDKDDREEWWAIQATAGVGHPAGRPYHVHECRNLAATLLLLADVDEHIVTSLLGHSSVAVSRRYMSVHRPAKLDAVARAGTLLGLPAPE